MLIQILGSGCPKCKKLEENVRKAVEEIGLSDAQVEHVYDLEKIIKMGVMMTPALVIDSKVVFGGRVPGVGELKSIIERFVGEK